MAETPIRHVRVGPDWDRAQAIAKETGDNFPEYIRRKVREYIREHEDKGWPRRANDAARIQELEDRLRELGETSLLTDEEIDHIAGPVDLPHPT